MTLSGQLQGAGVQLELLTGPLTGIYDLNGMGAMSFAVALKNKGVPVPDITKKLTIKTGKNAGRHPSVASLYRALTEAEEAAVSDDAPVIGPRRPVRASITGPGSGTDPELMERLTAQALGGDTVLDAPTRQAQDSTGDVMTQLLAQSRTGDDQ
ncbi:hypothetical protein [Streptomyces sp. NPDC058579]|uniref:hypothetical protein n=1 Tax=Streptomyces sp. NPDC058579 TaxID=3346548 RepID=UPI003663042C